MTVSRRWVTNMKIVILLKKGSEYATVSLKQEEYHIYLAQRTLQSL